MSLSCPYEMVRGRWQCPYCGDRCRRPHSRPPLRRCDVLNDRLEIRVRAPCRHKGTDVIRKIDCPSCGPRLVKLHVFRCAVFSECTIAGGGPHGLAECVRCQKYEPADLQSCGSSANTGA